MNWTTTSVELDDNQAQIKDTDMNKLAIRRDNSPYKSIR